MLLVCSNKPRDVHHIATMDNNGRFDLTLCKINASDWLAMGNIPSNYADDGDLCQRCKIAFEALA